MSLWMNGRRMLAITVGVGGMLICGATVAVAEPPPPPPPNCTAADLARVASGVTSATSDYMFAHPDVNNFFTGLKGLPKEDMKARVQQYMDANPQVKTDLQGVRQPMADFRSRCGE